MLWYKKSNKPMTPEHEPSNHHNPLKLLEGRNYVLAETFSIRKGFFHKKARKEVLPSLYDQGITDPVVVTFCNSEKKRIKKIIQSLKKNQSASDDPWMCVVGFTVDPLKEIFEAISKMIINNDPVLEGVDGKNITILQLNAPTSNAFIDRNTGLKFAALRKGEPSHPMHPTPNS